MISIPVPLLTDDVEILGRVRESQLSAAYARVMLSADRKVYRLDHAAGSLRIVDDTVPATAGATDSWSPFSSSPIPAGATLRVFDSTDGVWASNELTLTQGSVADLRSTGWKRFTFGPNAARVAWRPSAAPNSAIPSRKYLRFELDDGGDKDSFIVACHASDTIGVYLNVTTAGSTSVAVKVANVVLLRREEDRKWTDTLAVHTGALVSYTPAQATWMPIVGSEVVLGLDNIGYALEEYLYRENGSGAVWTVSASGPGDTWIPLTDYVSGSDFHQNGPSALAAAEHFTSTFTPPATWTKRSLGSLDIEGGAAVVTPSQYWLRYVLTSAASEAPQQTSSYRTRARQYGSANVDGAAFASAISVRAASLHLRGSKSGTGARSLTLANLTTGVSRAMVIPSASVPGDVVPLSFAALALAAGDKLGVIPTAGGASYQDATLYLEAV